MNPAWAAVAVAAATVVANVLGVWWVGRMQRTLARAERLGDREIEVYVELLRWVEGVDSLDPLLDVILVALEDDRRLVEGHALWSRRGGVPRGGGRIGGLE